MSRNATADLELSVDCYATLEEILPYLPWVSLNSTSRPSKKQALKIIRDSYDEMNSLLSEQGYAVPVASTAATAINLLGKLNSLDSAAAIDLAMRGANAGVSPQGSALMDRRNLLWKQFATGKMEIIGASRTGNYALRPSEQKSKHRFYQISGAEQDPVFTRDKKF